IGAFATLASPERTQQVLRYDTEYLSSVDTAIKYSNTRTHKGGGRLVSLTDAWTITGRHYMGRWVGCGPGMAGEGAYATATLRNQGELKIAVTQVDFLLVDLGIPGVLILLGMVAVTYWINLRAFWRARSRPDRAVTFAMFGIIPLYAAFFMYLPCWI